VVSYTPRDAVIGEDLLVQGEISNGGTIGVHGTIEGKVSAERIIVHPGGRVIGILAAGIAEVHGLVQGNVSVRQLLGIGGTGIVRGDVRYGQITMAVGGELTAELRNIPPEIVGDFEIVVRRGRNVFITGADVAAHDPDDHAGDLTFTVSNPANGHVARATSPSAAIQNFTQAELMAGHIVFAHDGSDGGEARFEVCVVDKAGASSGTPKAVKVAVVPA